MSLENDFLVFAGASGANVLTQSAYASATATATGYVSGVASSAAINKTLRQTSIMSAMIAQFIVDKAAQPVVDDGTIATIETNFEAAILAIADTVNIPMSQVTGLTAALAGYLPLHATADAAAKLANARNIALTGAVTGAINFDGSTNVSIATTFETIAANSFLANPTGSTASPVAVTLANGLQFSSTTLGMGAITPTSVTTSGGISVGTTLSVTGVATLSGGLSSTTGSFSSTLTAGGDLTIGETQAQIHLNSSGSGGNQWSIVSCYSGSIAPSGTLLFYNSTTGGELMTLSNGGVLTVFGSATNGNTLIVEDTSTGASGFAGITLKSGNGATTPNKTWRANGSTGALELVNSAYSAVVLTITDGGSINASGSVTCTTVNATSSDETLKTNFVTKEPQPLHQAWYGEFDRTDVDFHGRGLRAQNVRKLAPWHVYENHRPIGVDGETEIKLSVDLTGVALEEAFWAGRKVDELLQRVAALEARS